MNTISRHISYLLLTCRKVTVPGLGTFSTSYERAIFNLREGRFYPSRIRVCYSETEKEDKSLLQKSLERKLQLKENDIENIITEYVEKVKNRISKNNYCRLDGIGYLFLDQNLHYSFKDTFCKGAVESQNSKCLFDLLR